MVDQDKLVEQYSGAGASGYDDRRRTTARFKSEVAVFERLFDQTSPGWVIDCPFGTGRWIDFYLRVEGPVLAVDASEAMLEQARVKIEAAGARIKTVVGSIFDSGMFRRPEAPGDGLIVCIRFLNWVSMPQVSQALDSMATAGAVRMIVGVSVVPADWSWVKRLAARLKLSALNLPQMVRGRPTPYVHDEQGIHDLFAARGWKVMSKEFVFEDACRANYFFLLDTGSR